MTTYIYKDELYHHGIKGQKWGIRRFQNPDGSYTAEGRQRRSDSYPDEKSERRKKIAKRVAIGAAVVGGTILAVYGAKKLSDISKMNKSKAMSFKMKNDVLNAKINKTAHELRTDTFFGGNARYGHERDSYAEKAKTDKQNIMRLKYLRAENSIKYNKSAGPERSKLGYPDSDVNYRIKMLADARKKQASSYRGSERDYWSKQADKAIKSMTTAKYETAEWMAGPKGRQKNLFLNGEDADKRWRETFHRR